MTSPGKTDPVRFPTRGRVTIPAAWRRQYGLKGPTRLALAVTPAGFLLKLSSVADQIPDETRMPARINHGNND